MAAATMSVLSYKRVQPQGIPTNYEALVILVTVFFFRGFVAAGNSIFIPFCKHCFNLGQFQSPLIDFTFYGAYYLGALGFFAYGSFDAKELVAKLDYKSGMASALLFAASGAVAMILGGKGILRKQAIDLETRKRHNPDSALVV